MTTNFQLLMLSPNLLRSQIPYMVGGGGGFMMTNFQLLSAESKSADIPNSVYGGGGGGGGVHDNQLPTFDAESKSAKIPNSLYAGGKGVFMTTNFQLLMPSPNLLRSQIAYMLG